MSGLFTGLYYGRVHVRPKGSTLPPFEFGPFRTVAFTPELTELTIADPRSRSNSELDGVSRASGGTLEGELLELPPESLAALLGSINVSVASGTVAAETKAAMVGRTIITDKLPLAITSLTSEDGTDEYEADVDFVKTPGGIRILPGGQLATDIAATVADADGNKSLLVKYAYTYPKTNLVEAFIQGRKYYEVFIETTNEAGELQNRRVKIRRSRIGLSGELPLINRDDFAVVGVTFTLSEDPDFFGAGESALLKWEETSPD
jgi:hypothetical protein